MESKNYIKDIQMFINEVYSDNEPLQDNQIRSKKILNNYCNKIKQDLERLEQLEKIFNDSHICEIKARFNEIECSADKCDNCPLGIGDGICLKNTFEKKWELQKENQELKKPKFDLSLLDNAKKIEVDYNEELLEKIKILEKENKKLKKENEILSHNSTNIVMTDTKVMKRNLELQTEIQELQKTIKIQKNNYRDCNNERLFSRNQAKTFEEENEKLKKAIELLKDMFNINLWVDDMDCYIRIGKCDYLISWEQYKILSEVLGND